MKKPKMETKKVIGIKIDYHISEAIITRFASNVLVQSLENEFKISFFEYKPEIRLLESQPVPDTIKAECVASVILAPVTIPKLIDALQQQLNKFNLMKQTNK